MTCVAETDAPSEVGSLRVLVADDQPHVRHALCLLLKSAGHRADTADSPAAALETASRNRYDIVLLDMNYARDTTSGDEGLALLERFNSLPGAPPVIAMTAWGRIDLAVEAMRRGADDFVEKPWDNDKLLGKLMKHAGAVRRQHSDAMLARDVQQRLLVPVEAGGSAVDYAARTLAATGIGGDYCDFLPASDGKLGTVLADVSGKGTAAALLMANLQGLVRSQYRPGVRPAEALEAVNRLFAATTLPEHYATLFFGEYDPRTHVLDYVNCGHHAPYLLRAKGGFERLDSTCTVLGLFQEWSAVTHSVMLEAGDVLVAFSDGVVEAEGVGQQEFGEDRLLRILTGCRNYDAARLTECVLDEVQRYSRDGLSDDVTVVALRIPAVTA